MRKSDALYNMAEAILEDFGGKVEKKVDKQAAAWAKMNYTERMEMAKMVNDWISSR
jgi:hypothetical protein